MQTRNWDPGRIGQILSKVRTETGLNQADLARYAGKVESTVTRWIQGRTQPTYESVTQLAAELERNYPKLGDLPRQLIAAAGYEPGQGDVRASGEGALPDIAVLQREIDRLMAELPPERRARVERIIADEEAELDRLRRERLRRWTEMVRLASPDPD